MTKRAISAALCALALGACTSATLTEGTVLGDRVLYAEVRDGAGSDRVYVIVCDVRAKPPCVQVRVDRATAASFRRWVERADAARPIPADAPVQPPPGAAVPAAGPSPPQTVYPDGPQPEN